MTRSTKYLLISADYPSHTCVYTRGFVHQRVKAYQRAGLDLEVFALKVMAKSLSHYEYEGVKIYVGDMKCFHTLTSANHYDKYLVHIINKYIAKAINIANPSIPILVWVHGSETEAWRRRIHSLEVNLNMAREIIQRYKLSKKRMRFMKEIYSSNKLVHFIFVSQWIKNVAENDTNCLINNHSVIHNYINEELFKYHPKVPNDRLNILSIRSFKSNTYANDLAVKAILKLSKTTCFNHLTFSIYGDGRLFEKTVKPLRRFTNINLQRGFITQNQISALYKTHGVFLCPSRYDTQGVSRGEAMSAGLVPITNRIAAIPEFVDHHSAMLAKPGAYKDLADAIEYIYHNPEAFLRLSQAAHARVTSQCGYQNTIAKELALIRN